MPTLQESLTLHEMIIIMQSRLERLCGAEKYHIIETKNKIDRIKEIFQEIEEVLYYKEEE